MLLPLAGVLLSMCQPASPAITGFAPSDQPSFEDRKAALNAAATPESLRQWHMLLGSEPHIAGTDGGSRTIERLRVGFSEMGLETEVWDFWPLLATPVGAELEIISPTPMKLDLAERPVKGDPASAGQGFGW